MKQLTTLSLLFILGFSVTTNAQITYEHTDFAENGEIFNVVNLPGDTVYDFTETGPSYFWDFDALSDAEVTPYGYEDPNNSPFKLTWCLYHFYITNCDSKFDDAFNMGIGLGDFMDLGDLPMQDAYQHLMKSPDELQSKMLGAYVDLEGTHVPLILEYEDADVLFKFPMQYQGSFTDNNSISMDFNAIGLDAVINSTGIRSNLVDGWGDLKIRGYTFENVLRVRSELQQNFDVTFDGEPMNMDLNTVSYFWFDKNYGIPVLMVNGTEIGGIFTPATITYLNNGLMNTAEFVNSAYQIVPNPTDGQIDIRLPQREEVLKTQIFDLNGRILGKKADLQKMNPGTYILKVQTSKRVITEKIIRK